MSIKLYVVSTPIGNLKDFTIRGIETLKSVNYILCEDSRVTRKLLDHYSIDGKLLMYNDHNATLMIPKILHRILNQGSTFALVSDAGTPLISDPGYKLIRALRENGVRHSIVPGACSVISSIVLSGFETTRFTFCGFFDKKNISDLVNMRSSLIFFESPKRILKTIKLMQQVFSNREISVTREMTKVHEEVVSGDFDKVLDYYGKNSPKGEITIVLSQPRSQQTEKTDRIKSIIEILQNIPNAKLSKKDISNIVSKLENISKTSSYNFMKD
jgi:16S rRNA (cytidine1402-2'-O)-methyltransferase